MYGKFVDIKCAHCGKLVSRAIGHVNRAKKIGAPLYCDKTCFGLGHRKNKSDKQKKAEKRQYDMEYRNKNRAMLKAKKAARFQNRSQERRDYEKEYRQKNMGRHVKYCQRQEYVRWKKEYDAKYRAKRMFGEYWESFMLALSIDREVRDRMSKEEVAIAKGYYNKAQHRRREYEKLISYQS